MIQVTLTLENPGDYEFLKGVFERSVKKLEKDPQGRLSTMTEQILRVNSAINEADIKTVRNTQPNRDIFVPNLCKEHPKYAAVRAPRTDCDFCWAAYKKMNPDRYDKAKRLAKKRQGVAGKARK